MGEPYAAYRTAPLLAPAWPDRTSHRAMRDAEGTGANLIYRCRGFECGSLCLQSIYTRLTLWWALHTRPGALSREHSRVLGFSFRSSPTSQPHVGGKRKPNKGFLTYRDSAHRGERLDIGCTR